MRSATADSGPTRCVPASRARNCGGGFVLAPGQVEVLDLCGLVDVPVVLGDRVVEVLVSHSHAADVQRGLWAGEVEHAVGALAGVLLADRDHPTGEICSCPSVGSRSARPRLEVVAPHARELLGVEEHRQPAIGVAGGGGDAAAHQARPVDRDVGRLGRLISFSGLPSPVPWPAGSGNCTSCRRHHRLAAPRHATDVDVLPDAGHRVLVRHPMEALDDLRPRRAEAEHEATVADEVAPGRGLGDRGGGPGEHVDDPVPISTRSVLRRGSRPG